MSGVRASAMSDFTECTRAKVSQSSKPQSITHFELLSFSGASECLLVCVCVCHMIARAREESVKERKRKNSLLARAELEKLSWTQTKRHHIAGTHSLCVGQQRRAQKFSDHCMASLKQSCWHRVHALKRSMISPALARDEPAICCSLLSCLCLTRRRQRRREPNR